jgi:hypothetical protein
MIAVPFLIAFAMLILRWWYEINWRKLIFSRRNKQSRTNSAKTAQGLPLKGEKYTGDGGQKLNEQHRWNCFCFVMQYSNISIRTKSRPAFQCADLWGHECTGPHITSRAWNTICVVNRWRHSPALVREIFYFRLGVKVAHCFKSWRLWLVSSQWLL